MSTVVMPIIVVCLFGSLVQRWVPIQTESLANVSLYILAPSLVLGALAGSDKGPTNLWSIVEFTALQTALCWGVAACTAKLCRFQPEVSSGITLTTVFGNASNYGLPVLLLAYGTTGLVNGATYVIGQIVLMNCLGLYIASRSKVRPREALVQILKTPLIYAVILGAIVCLFQIAIPKGVMSGLQMLGNSYPALVLVILGIQLGRIRWTGIRRKEVWIAVILRQCVVPILSELCIWMIGIHGILASILLVQSSMPAAVNAIVVANKYGSDKELITLTVAITTIISFLSLPLLISMT